MATNNLYLGDKTKTVTDPSRLPVVFRAIERWADSLQTGGGGGAYASLTGPGETVTPGALTQQGPFSVSDSSAAGSGGMNFTSFSNNIQIAGQSTPAATPPGQAGVYLLGSGSGYGIAMVDSSAQGIFVSEQSVGVPIGISGSGPLSITMAGAITNQTNGQFAINDSTSTVINWSSTGGTVVTQRSSVSGAGFIQFAPGSSPYSIPPGFYLNCDTFALDSAESVIINDNAAAALGSGVQIFSTHNNLQLGGQTAGLTGQNGLQLGVSAAGNLTISVASGTGNTITINQGATTNHLVFSNLPTTNPGGVGFGRIWNNGGVLNIT